MVNGRDSRPSVPEYVLVVPLEDANVVAEAFEHYALPETGKGILLWTVNNENTKLNTFARLR